MKGIKRLMQYATDAVSKEISNHASYYHVGGLAAEGYNGGYRDALYDVLLAMNGCVPQRNGWWIKTEEEPKKHKRKLKCEDCGVVSEEVEKGTCPYDSEINSVETPVVLCPNCYQQRAYDI